MRNDYKIRPRPGFKAGGKAKKGFPDLNKDGKITKADILKGRGVFKKGGMSKKADMITKNMSSKKKGKMMKDKR